MQKKALSILLSIALILPALLVAGGVLFAPESPFESFDEMRNQALYSALGKNCLEGNSFFSAPLPEENRYIVQFLSTASQEDIAKSLENVPYKLLAESERKLFVVSADKSFLDKNSSIIDYAEVDLPREVQAVTADPITLPAYDKMGIPTAWDSVQGDNKVIVAVLDTGVNRTHEELSSAAILSGYDAVSGKAGINDDISGHGTSVIGFIAATANNGVGFAGVAHGVSILPVKVSVGATTIFSSDLISGIRFAADAGAKIINMSVGGFSSSYAEQAAVDYAISKGCIMIAAAGNGGALSYGDQKSYPASYEGVISVASCDMQGKRSKFSQYNDMVDVAAPGEDVPLLIPEDGSESYTLGSGTSFSCAFVSGIAALAATKIGDEARFANDEFLSLIIDTCGSSKSSELGHGVINAPAILSLVDEPIITGVFHNGIFHESVMIGFNRGTATLDGVPIDDGEAVMTNGTHLLTVTYGEKVRNVRFALNFSPLTYKYNKFASFVTFEFTRGSATLDGFPYGTGEKISSSGDHIFVLTDGDERLEKKFNLSFSVPDVFGVEDGGEYDTPIDIRIIGEGSATLDGKGVFGRVTVVTGTHTLTVKSRDGAVTQSYNFTVNASVSLSEIDYADATAAVDEEKGYICLYGDSLVGARIYDINTPERYTAFLPLGRVYGHLFIGEDLVLVGDGGITVIDRTTAIAGEGAIKLTYQPEGIYKYFCGDNTVYGITDQEIFVFDIYGQTFTKLCDIDRPAEDGYYYDGNILVRYDYGGLALVDCESKKITDLEIAPSILQNVYFGNGYIGMGNALYNLKGELAAEVPSNEILLVHDGKIFTENMIFSLESGEELGRFPFAVSDIVLGAGRNYIYGLDPVMAWTEVLDGGISSFCAASSAMSSLSSPQRVNPYRDNLFYDVNTPVISAVSVGSDVVFLMADDNRVYSFNGKTLAENSSFVLKYLPKEIFAGEGYIAVLFQNANKIYIAPQTDTANGQYIDTEDFCQSVAFFNGKLYMAADGKLVSMDTDGKNYKTEVHSAEKIVAAGENLAVYSGNTLSLYNKNLALTARVNAEGGRLSAGNAIGLGNRIYSIDTLLLLHTLDEEIYAFSGDIVATKNKVFDLVTGEIAGDLGVSSKAVAICGVTEVIAFGSVISVNSFKDGTPILTLPTVAGIEEGVAYHDSVIVTYDKGMGYVDGAGFASGSAVKGTGEHIFVSVLPFGRQYTVKFIVDAHLSGIEFLSDRTMSVGETINLKLKYLPHGASSVPVSFFCEADGIILDENGNVTAVAEGVYKVIATADTHIGSFSAECKITVRNDLIAFVPESGITIDRDNGYALGIPAGLSANRLLAMLYVSDNAYVYDRNGKILKTFVGTGCEIRLYDSDGNVCDSLKTVVMGDTDGDGVISSYDLYEQGRILRGYQYEDIYRISADMNNNGSVADDDYRILKYIVLGRTPYELGTPQVLPFGLCTLYGFSAVEKGAVVEMALCLSGNKYARGIMGKLEYGDGVEFLSAESTGWESGCYDDGESISFFAYSKDGQIGGKAFAVLLKLRFRVTGDAGDEINISAPNVTLSLDDGCKKVSFQEYTATIAEPAIGDFNIDISNADGFSFDAKKHNYKVTIPYDSALADIVITRPADSEVTVENAVVPLSGEGLAVITYTDLQGQKIFYSIEIHREKEPDFDTNCRLETLEIEGFYLEPSFNHDVLEYNVFVPHGTEKLNLYCRAENSSARVIISDTNITGESSVITVMVVSPDGESLTYTLNVTVLPPEENSEESQPVSVSPPAEKGNGGWIVAIIAVLLLAGAGIAAYLIYKNKKQK